MRADSPLCKMAAYSLADLRGLARPLLAACQTDVFGVTRIPSARISAGDRHLRRSVLAGFSFPVACKVNAS